MTEQIERLEEAAERADAARSERTGYDARAAQERWQAFWEENRTFVPADDGSAERRYVLDMFPYPSGDLHMGHAEAFVMGDVVARYLKLQRLRRTPPDRLGLLRTACRECRDRAQRAPGRVDVRQHRDPGDVVPALRTELRLVSSAAYLGSGVLPLDAVAVPALPGTRPGLPEGQLRQLVPAGPDGAGQRAGDRRAVRTLRLSGHQAAADPVVLQDHRVRPAAAGRHG